ncbi:uncharacterized protein with LGFP repeats [Sinomonas atrocyanea]|uniref:LGFP repeat-containing protein n=1 Tax=Sinomonas atrocyanea TaxID=37927 RepID=UPI0027854F14|nr:hypothetical protein [Sinomonas atrocyanea]MDP9886092.1 uncharacterized protein with LGFP repeats [Sinomonas atrocyanea]
MTPTPTSTPSAFEVHPQLQARWAAEGGGAGPLGQPIGAARCGGPYCYQSFQGGFLNAVHNSVDNTWQTFVVRKSSGVTGPKWYELDGAANFDLPLSDEVTLAGGSYQRFRAPDPSLGYLSFGYIIAPAGKAPYAAGPKESRMIDIAAMHRGIYVPHTGPYPVFEVFGFPDAPATCTLAGGGCEMTFGGGAWRFLTAPNSTVGGYQPASPIGAAYVARGAEQSAFGYPEGIPSCDASGTCTWTMEKADLHLTRGVVHAVPPVIRSASRYGAVGGAVDEAVCGLPGDRCRQTFERGVVYASPTRGVSLAGGFYDKWRALGGEAGPLGLPVDDWTNGIGVSWQRFERGALAGSGSTLFVVKGAILGKYLEGGNATMGAPLGDEVCTAPRGGCYQWFGSGLIWWSPAAGVHTVRNDGFRYRYEQENWAWGALGYPLEDIQCTAPKGGCYQKFQGGTLWTDLYGTGRMTRGAIGAKYASTNYAWGRLGRVTSEEFCYGNACYQYFEGGTIYWSPRTPATIVKGAIGSTWLADGKSTGLPTQDEQCTAPNGGCYQWFQNGVYWWNPNGGTFNVHDGIKAAYERMGWAWGRLGYPTSNEYFLGWTGSRQDFQHGSIEWRYPGSIRIIWR